MKNKIGQAFGIGLILAGLTACTPQEITFQGKVQPLSDVEEILADMIEVENPNLDIQVNIYEETE